MGVRGLFSFAESNSKCDFFEKAYLKNTKVVIDGNNLRFYIYNRLKGRNDAFGGEYKHYHSSVINYFKRLLEQKIEPIVIFDGSYEEGKKKTLWKRSREQLESAFTCSPFNQSKYSVMPIFAKDTFIEALQNLKIQIVQTFGEADRFIAHMGSRVYSCPVLSNDSDFLIFPNVDLIQLSSIDTENSSELGIKCKRFRRSIFLDFFGLANDNLLPLCAALLGNDETSGKLNSVVDRIFAQVKQDKAKKSVNRRHRRMAAILKYLGREKDSSDMKDALERLLIPVPAGSLRDDARKTVESAISAYVFSSEIKNCQDRLCDCISDEGNNSNFDQFRNDFEKGRLPNWCLDIIRHRHFYFQSQFEDFSQDSALSKCLPIISEIAFHLLSNEKDIEITITGRNQGRQLSNISIKTSNDSGMNSEEGILEFWCRHCDVSRKELSAVVNFLMSKEELQIAKNFQETHDKVTIHSLANFQAILYFSRVLLRLKGIEMSFPSMKNWSGRIMFSTIHKNDEDSQEPDYLKIFNTLLPMTSSRVNEIDIQKKRQRHRKPKTPIITAKVMFNDSDSPNESDSGDDLLENRFQLLSLER